MSRVTGSVFGYPSTTMPRESPTRRTSIPARSRILAIVKSYAVQTAIFSPRSFMARRSGTRTGFIVVEGKHKGTKAQRHNKSGRQGVLMAALVVSLCLRAFVFPRHPSLKLPGVPEEIV